MVKKFLGNFHRNKISIDVKFGTVTVTSSAKRFPCRALNQLMRNPTDGAKIEVTFLGWLALPFESGKRSPNDSHIRWNTRPAFGRKNMVIVCYWPEGEFSFVKFNYSLKLPEVALFPSERRLKLLDPLTSKMYKWFTKEKKFRCGMKPNRPRVVASSRNYITVGWSPCGPDEGSWYILQRKDEVTGWCRVYMGFKTQAEVGLLAPGNYYEFRLKVVSEKKESDWSDTLFAMTKDDVTPASHLHRVAENGPVTSLRKILSQRYPPVDIPNKLGLTPLRLAILKNNTNFMGILLSHGADIENVETGTGRTPLMMAAQRGLLEPVQLLLEKGSSWRTRDRNGLTAFNYAVDNSHLPIVELAIEHNVDVKMRDGFGWDPLMRGVVLKSSLEVLECLLDSGCDPNEADDRKQTVLMQAVLSERPEVVELLLKKGADVNGRNIYGHSAYDLAKSSTNERPERNYPSPSQSESEIFSTSTADDVVGQNCRSCSGKFLSHSVLQNVLKIAHLLGNEPEEKSKNNRRNPRERKPGSQRLASQ